jgi:hypothetical protein
MQLISAIDRYYRENFQLFWRIMVPLIFLSFLLDVAILYGFYYNVTNTSWTVSTSDGFSVTRFFQRGTGLYFTFTFSSFIAIFLWFAMCPLALAVYQIRRGMNVSSRSVWRQTLRRIRSILMASLLLLVRGAMVLVPLLLIFLALTSFPGAPIVLVLIAACIIVYFAVRWSLYNQCIIIEGLTAKAAFRRSSELVQGKWWAFFGRYLLLIWVSGVLTGLIFAITLILLSIANSEFVIIRETLLSERFIMLFFGIDIAFTFNSEAFVFGDIAATLDSRPSFWVIGVILVVKTLLCAAFEPIWAILTTHLYLQRTGEPDLVNE